MLKNVNNCDITYKTFPFLSFILSFFLITLVCGNESSGFQQLQWKHFRWSEAHNLNFFLARDERWACGHLKWKNKKRKENKQKKQHPGTKLETSEIKMVWRKEHKRPKSRTDHLNSGPLAMNSRQSAHSYLVYFVRGSCSDDFSVSKSQVQCFGLYSTRKVGPPKSIISFHSLHGRRVNLYIKLSHSSLSKNIMCLA